MTFLKITLQTILLVFLVLAAFILLMSRMPVFGLQSMVVLTGSMEPTMNAGSIVFVQPDPNYQTGDILTFKNKAGAMVTHRLVEKKEESGTVMFRVKGDANEQPDSELVSPMDVVGKSVFFVASVGKITQLLKTPQGFVGLIVVPALVFVGLELRNIKREIEHITEKRVMEKMKAEGA